MYTVDTNVLTALCAGWLKISTSADKVDASAPDVSAASTPREATGAWDRLDRPPLNTPLTADVRLDTRNTPTPANAKVYLSPLSVCLSVYLSIYPSIRPSVHPPTYLPTYLPTYYVEVS